MNSTNRRELKKQQKNFNHAKPNRAAQRQRVKDKRKKVKQVTVGGKLKSKRYTISNGFSIKKKK